MSVFEKYVEKQKAAAPATPEEPSRSLKDILADKADSQVFGKYLEEEGEEDLAASLATGELSADQLEELAGPKRLEFLKLMERSERILETLDADMLKELVSISPDLAKIVNIAGPEGIQSALRRYLPELVILYRDRFEDLEENILNIQEKQKEAAESDKAILDICKEYNITEAQYVELLEGKGDAAEIAQKLRSSKGFWERRGLSVATLEKKLKDQVAADKLAFQDLKNEIDFERKRIALSLRTSFRGTDQLREAMILNLRGEALPKQEVLMSFSEMKKENDAKPTEDQVKKDWEKWVADNSIDLDDPDTDLVAKRAEFAEQYANRRAAGKKGGFWSTIFQGIFQGTIVSMLESMPATT